MTNLQSDGTSVQCWQSAFVRLMQAKLARSRFIFRRSCGFKGASALEFEFLVKGLP